MLSKTVLEKPLRKPLRCSSLHKTAEAAEKRKVAKPHVFYGLVDAPGPEITWSGYGQLIDFGTPNAAKINPERFQDPSKVSSESECEAKVVSISISL